MQRHRRAFDECLVTFLWILPRRISEISTAQSLPDSLSVAAAGDDRVFITFHNLDKLIPDILCPSHGTSLDEILKTPWIGVLVLFPAVVDVQKRQVVTMRVMELCLLLIRLSLFVLRTVEHSGH